MTFEIKRMQFKDSFSIIKIELNTQVECLVDIDDLVDKIIPNTIYKKDRGFSYTVYELKNGNLGAFYTVQDCIYDTIVKDVEEIMTKYFNVL